MRILFAILSVLIGLSLVFGGYRLARWLIPLMGFMFGLSFGGAIISDAAGTSFLGSFLGVVIGILAGLILAAFAYAYYYFAVLVLAGGFGYWAGSGLVLLLGFSPGILSAMVGIVLGILVGIVAIVLNAPKYVLIVLTSMIGAVASVGGVLLLFNQIPLSTFSYATVNAALSNSFFWTLGALVLWIVGIVSQIRLVSGTYEYEFNEWGTRNAHHHPPTPTLHAPQP
jgi:hypothetical protein